MYGGWWIGVGGCNDIVVIVAYRERNRERSVCQYCASSANTIMLVANAKNDHTIEERTCQVSRELDFDFVAGQNI